MTLLSINGVIALNWSYDVGERARRRVFITGWGMVTPLGHAVPTLGEGLLTGRSGIGPVTRFDPTDLEVQIVAGVIQPEATSMSERRSLYSTAYNPGSQRSRKSKEEAKR